MTISQVELITRITGGEVGQGLASFGLLTFVSIALIINDTQISASCFFDCLPVFSLAVFTDAGVDLSRPVVTTCLTGMTACSLMFAAYLLGKDDVPLYNVGSYFLPPPHVTVYWRSDKRVYCFQHLRADQDPRLSLQYSRLQTVVSHWPGQQGRG